MLSTLVFKQESYRLSSLHRMLFSLLRHCIAFPFFSMPLKSACHRSKGIARNKISSGHRDSLGGIIDAEPAQKRDCSSKNGQLQFQQLRQVPTKLGRELSGHSIPSPPAPAVGAGNGGDGKQRSLPAAVKTIEGYFVSPNVM